MADEDDGKNCILARVDFSLLNSLKKKRLKNLSLLLLFSCLVKRNGAVRCDKNINFAASTKRTCKIKTVYVASLVGRNVAVKTVF